MKGEERGTRDIPNNSDRTPTSKSGLYDKWIVRRGTHRAMVTYVLGGMWGKIPLHDRAEFNAILYRLGVAQSAWVHTCVAANGGPVSTEKSSTQADCGLIPFWSFGSPICVRPFSVLGTQNLVPDGLCRNHVAAHGKDRHTGENTY
ncbi:hypothetical protein GOBAR_AA23150 [Gossypium barbadense]|uniref:Uncharacterized protein n=1 Tax=Gossypium barbadense TaxID=3634 RepID=A0A2P5X2H5_GOSBA|nr:hypothetical protein GOBAR_AA23150 [Gossypium barbadense]